LSKSKLGIVAIGQNEGERLIGCLQSAVRDVPPEMVVYVDSGSSDHSLENARNLSVTAIELDASLPFTAARARNTGFEMLRALQPNLEFVQFVDGDCDLAKGWIETAADFLAQHPDVALVCARTRERYPGRSIYNWLCDEEWNCPVGEIEGCGGIATIRIAAFDQIGGFRSELVAGEDTELCLRLREQGWKLWRLGREMAMHDAALIRFGQWWRRSARAGFAYADVSQLCKSSPMRIWRWEKMRAIFWGAILPLAVLSGALLNNLAFAGLLLYPAQICRTAVRRDPFSAASWRFAAFTMLSRFAEVQGLALYYLSRWKREATRLHYKNG
jgi:GT2 family glycosyltransferase